MVLHYIPFPRKDKTPGKKKKKTKKNPGKNSQQNYCARCPEVRVNSDLSF